jgi:polyisoprenoid-binding protein YceI
MKHLIGRYTILSSIVTVIGGGLTCFADSIPQMVGTESGTATFHAGTNVPGIEVKGTSNALSARADVVKHDKGLLVERIEASLPVKSLATGMKIRDEHMRKYIFATSGGQEPDIQFIAGTVSCPALGAAQGYACQLSGSLSIRGLSRPITVNLKVKEQSGSASAFRVTGEGIVKLSDYGIAAPSQFGVKPVNEVEIHLDFTGRQSPALKASLGGGQ